MLLIYKDDQALMKRFSSLSCQIFPHHPHSWAVEGGTFIVFKEGWKIKPPPASEWRLCFRAVPLLCISEQYKKVHLGLEGHTWDKGAAIQPSNA